MKNTKNGYRPIAHRQISLPEGRELTLAAFSKPSAMKARKNSPPLHDLVIGHALKNPSDKTSKEMGLLIAENRAVTDPHFVMEINADKVSQGFVSSLLTLIETEFQLNLTNYVKIGRRTAGKPEAAVISRQQDDTTVKPSAGGKRKYTKRSTYWEHTGNFHLKFKPGKRSAKVQRRKKKVVTG